MSEFQMSTIRTGLPTNKSCPYPLAQTAYSNSYYDYRGNQAPPSYQPRNDPSHISEAITERRRSGLQKFKVACLVQVILGVATSGIGIAILVVSSPNIGFPVFNFGPLLAGILIFIGGSVGYLGTTRSLRTSEVQRSYIVGNFVFIVIDFSISMIAGIFAFLSGAVCYGADIKFYNSRNNDPATLLDVNQYCYPNIDENAALAIVGGVLCIAIFVVCIYGTVLFCCYGRVFEFKGRYRNRLSGEHTVYR